MVYKIENLLNVEERKELIDVYKEGLKKNVINWDDNYKTHLTVGENTFGFAPPLKFSHYLEKFKYLIIENGRNIFDENLIEGKNIYMREYKNGSFLNKHLDRTDVNMTMSICLSNTTNKEWPIYVDIGSEIKEINLNVGDALILLNSDKLVHWRDRLICEENQSIIQLFLLWRERKNIKTLL